MYTKTEWEVILLTVGADFQYTRLGYVCVCGVGGGGIPKSPKLRSQLIEVNSAKGSNCCIQGNR